MIQIVGHSNCVAVAYRHCVCILWYINYITNVYYITCSAKESKGWELIYTTPPLEKVPSCIALNARVTAASLGDKMLAVVLGMYYIV